MQHVLWQLLVAALPAVAMFSPVVAAAAAPSTLLQRRPGCPSKCGEVEIPYPFGIGDGCAWPGFTVDCNQSFSLPRPYYGNIEIIHISLDAGEMRIYASSRGLRLVQLIQHHRLFSDVAAQRHRVTVPGRSEEKRVHGHWLRNGGMARGQGRRSYLTRCITTCIWKRRQVYINNGGQLLKGMEIVQFKENILEKITENRKTWIGEGFFGEVYKGTHDNQPVAVKYSKAKRKARMLSKVMMRNKSQNVLQNAFYWSRVPSQDSSQEPGQEIVDDLRVQSQLHHENVVRLIGCCIETEEPTLVLEFLPKGSLEKMLHGSERQPLSLLQRLNIAIGSVEALSYMHNYPPKASSMEMSSQPTSFLMKTLS
uniref:Protein kinase domain-containing protein n=1 Tax=Oryza brachyantha TaxID=4533 RepID=J3NAB5_ORYBR